MKKRVGKKAQGFLGMGFGMIFSIFLIIIFIAVAIYAITKFLDYKDCIQIGTFMGDLQDEVSVVFNRQAGDFPFPRTLPTKIDFVCFGNLSKPIKGSSQDIGQDLARYDVEGSNMFFYPRENACLKTNTITHLNITSMTKKDNPYCIPVINGKITITVSRGFAEGLVKLS